MKRSLLLFLALVAFSPLAHGERIAWAKNDAGGEIVLTDSPCVFNGETYKTLMSMFATGQSGLVEYGCWHIQDGYVHAIYFNGRQRAYPLRVFVLERPRQKNDDFVTF